MVREDETAFVIELKDGTEVECNEFWACDNDVFVGSESGNYVDVIDCDTNEVLCTFMGELPDVDDEEAVEAFIESVNENVFNF